MARFKCVIEPSVLNCTALIPMYVPNLYFVYYSVYFPSGEFDTRISKADEEACSFSTHLGGIHPTVSFSLPSITAVELYK